MRNRVKQQIDFLVRCLVKVGGLWAAIFAPAAIVIVGFIIPFANPTTLTHLIKLFQSGWFKCFLFFMMVLPVWYGLNRILLTLDDMAIKCRRSSAFFYGLAFAWSAHIGYVLFFVEQTQ